MEKNPLTQKNYYENYAGFDIRIMYERIKMLALPATEAVYRSIRERSRFTSLALDSATPENIDSLAALNTFLRGEKTKQDTVIIIDQNQAPLVSHKEKSAENPDSYPDFQYVQADMRNLPLRDASIDCVISDYTLNFLSSVADVRKTFEHIARVLTKEGIAYITMRGNDNYKALQENSREIIDDDQTETVAEGITMHHFPLRTYIEIARQCGLVLLTHTKSGNDICALFKKVAA